MRTRLLIAVVGLSTLVMPSIAARACYFYDWAPGCESQECEDDMGIIWIGTGEYQCSCGSPGAWETCQTSEAEQPPICYYEYDLEPDCENLVFDCTWGTIECWSP